MFDIGMGEMLLLAAIALIAIGPKQLPEVARVIGRTLNELKRTTGDLSRAFTETRDLVSNHFEPARSDGASLAKSEFPAVPVETPSGASQMSFDIDPDSQQADGIDAVNESARKEP